MDFIAQPPILIQHPIVATRLGVRVSRPLEVVAWRKRSVLHDAPACTGCSRCERRCPFGVITMIKSPRPASGQT
jgi:formate hydrogenlyase subunit 6/NADH:ubiquinone oxidoreductase subunit I